MTNKITVSGVGCCLVDRLYNHLDFNSDVFKRFLSRTKGDGGLMPGQLVLKEEFDRFAGVDFLQILPALTEGHAAETVNTGGPCIVALIHAAQISGEDAIFRFYGCHGDDDDGLFLLDALTKTPIDTCKYRLEKDTVTASTIVLSDPEYDNGNGERVFINTIGASWNYRPDELDADFFASDIVVFGATALMPQIHDHLTELLAKAKEHGCFTIVNTVFDFRSEKVHPENRWMLGKSDDSYRHIDLLITDHEEALRLSGTSNTADAMMFFKSRGVGAAVITNGARNISVYSSGQVFEPLECTMPVSEAISAEIRQGRKGDTTGCGDNFAGGMIASVVKQLQANKTQLCLTEACRWGVVSGGFACFYTGGAYLEKVSGEKSELLQNYYEKYLKQTGYEG